MPKIKITEHDKTGAIQTSKIANTVFIPMLDASLNEATEIKAIKSINDLNAFINAKASAIKTNNSLGYRLAKHTLNVGLDVLVQIVKAKDNIDWTSLADKSLYDVRFLTLGDTQPNVAATDLTPAAEEGDSSPEASTSDTIYSCAFKRGDCVVLLNVPVGYNNYKADIAAEGFSEFSEVSNGEYVAAFVPNFKTLNSDLAEIDDGETKETEIPAAFGYIFAYANMIKNNPEWYAVAGFQRGIIPELSDVCYDLSGGEIDLLQKRTELDDPSDNVGVAINPIANIRPAGYVIYGNRTMKSNDAAKKTTAKSFLNVRNIISAIKKQTYNAARTFTFEPNTEMLWIRFKAYIQPLLDQMQNNNGILGYKFTRLKTDAKARLKCSIAIVPVEAVEDFEIKVVLTDDLSVSE